MINVFNKIKSYLGSGSEVAKNRVTLKLVKNSLTFNISQLDIKSII